MLNLNKIINIKKYVIKYKTYLICLGIIILSIISLVIQMIDKKNSMTVNSNNIKNSDGKIAVYITGEVANPGVFYLKENARLYELLDMCGGVTKNADVSNINLAKKLNDSDMITVLAKKEDEDIDEESDISTSNENGKVNINTASKEELMGLNGIGEQTAQKIIDYRKQQKFVDIEDIKNVGGIGESKYESIKEYICT